MLTTLCLGAFSAYVSAQSQKPSPTPPPQPQSEDVIRINTDLVQTDVMVFDKQGRFVEGLQREQFELSVDGKPQPISFSEQVKAGSSRETAQLASITKNPAASEKATPVNDSRGRTIVFFIDDLHLALDSLGRTRKALTQFIDNEMNCVRA